MEAVLNNSEIASMAEQIFQSVFAVINEGVVILNDHAEIIAVNPAAESMFGLATAELIGQSANTIARVANLIHEDGSELSQDGFSAIVASRLRNMVLGVCRPDGTLVWLSINSQALIPNGASAPYAEAIIFSDITERKRTEQALAVREHEFRNLADSSPDSIIRYDCNGRMRYLNPGLLRFLGLSATEVIGRLPIEVWPDGRYAEIDRAIVQALETEEATIVELSGADAAGAPHSSRIHVVPERDAAGQIVGAIAFGLNATAIREAERKQAERALELTRNYLRGVLQSIPDLVWVKDTKGVYLSCNHAFERFFGAKEVEIIGKTDYDFVDAELADFFRQKDREAIAQDRVCINEEWVTFADDNRRVLLEVRKVPLRDTDGKVTGVLGISHDITERKRAEEALRASEQQFRTLAENLPDILIRYDLEGRRTYVNPAMERIFAVPARQMTGLTPQEANPVKLPEAYHKALQHTLATGERSEFEIGLPVLSGEIGVGFITMAAERDAAGKICGALAIGRDVTNLKNAEQQLRKLTVHLQNVREEEKAKLAREIHDDLGSTLAALKLRLSHLLDFELSEEMKKTPMFARLEYMSSLLESAIAAARRIITDMRPDVLDNLGLLAALKWQAEQFSKHTGIACLFVHTGERDCASCKNCQYGENQTLTINLFRIFQEALTNVARHSGASRVEAEFRTGSDIVTLSIYDNGCGIAEGEFAATSFGIRGMRERVGQLCGEIEFDTPPEGGLRVTVRVPLPATGICRPVLL